MTNRIDLPNIVAGTRRLFARLKADRKGGVLMITAFSLIPLTFVTGFAIDYSRAMSLQTHLNAAADAAALAAVSPSIILETDDVARAAATNMFNAQATLVTGFKDLVVTPVVVTSGASGSNSATGYLRKATVTYTAKSVNTFSGVLGVGTLTVTGVSKANAAQPPNVDFYLAMDNSPSMLLPSTSDGISRIIAATKNSDNANGCAFACHAQLAKMDNIYIKDTNQRHILLSTGYYTAGDSRLGVFYRWDSTTNTVLDASGNPISPPSTSTSTTTSSPPDRYGTITDTTTKTTTTTRYWLPGYTNRDREGGPRTVRKDVTTTTTTTTVKRPRTGPSQSPVTSQPSTTTTTTDYDTGYWADGYWLTHNYGRLFSGPASITLRKDDVVAAASQLIPFAASQASQYNVTYQAQMFSFDWTRPGGSSPVRTLNNLQNVASYGSGFSAASLFPPDDYWWKNGQPTNGTDNDDRASEVTNMLTVMRDTIPTAGSGAPGSTPQKILFVITDGMLDQPNGGGRYFGPLRTSDLSVCTAIKAKGIKIAILYTQYLPESLAGDTWSQNNVAPFLPAPPAPYPRGGAGNSDKVLAGLQSCASPGANSAPLVQTVTADDNISTALRQLFSTALQTSRLVQ